MSNTPPLKRSVADAFIDELPLVRKQPKNIPFEGPITTIVVLEGSELMYYQPYDRDIAIWLSKATRDDLTDRVINADLEGLQSEGWDNQLIDRLYEVTTDQHCAVFYFA
jgi:hypothetical protein